MDQFSVTSLYSEKCTFRATGKLILKSRKATNQAVSYSRPWCGTVNKVKTCKTHKSARGRPIFDVNTAAAAAMIHAGISQVAMERFASTLDIHPPCKTTVKRREREIGPIIEKVARASCEEAVGVESGLVGRKNGERVVNW